VRAIDGVSFDIRKGEVRAIIGPNGAGKSSLLNVINGFYHPQEGTITYKGNPRHQMRPHEAAETGIARTFQNVALFRGMSTLDNVMTGRLLKMSGPGMRYHRRRFADMPVINYLTYPAIWLGDFLLDSLYWGP